MKLEDNFYSNCYYLAKLYKLKIYQLEEIAGVSEGYFNKNWRKGYCPSLRVVVRVADYFHILIDDLVLKDLRAEKEGI